MRGVVSCAAVALFSCASSQRGFDRGALRTEETAAMPLQITDAEIGEALSRRPQLPPRFRLAIYARDAEPERAWRWSGREKDRILEAIDPLVSEGVVGDAFFLTSLVVERTDLKALRLAAARHGADALLLVTGTVEFDSSANAWALTWVALLPVFFAPGLDVEALFTARAGIWDVRNEVLYAAAESQSSQQRARPTTSTQPRELVDSVRSEAVGHLADEIARRLHHLAGHPGGSTTSKTQPLPGTSRTEIVPPCASTLSRAIESPSPSPLRSPDACTKGLNSAAAVPGSSPPHSSSTSITTDRSGA